MTILDRCTSLAQTGATQRSCGCRRAVRPPLRPSLDAGVPFVFFRFFSCVCVRTVSLSLFPCVLYYYSNRPVPVTGLATRRRNVIRRIVFHQKEKRRPDGWTFP